MRLSINEMDDDHLYDVVGLAIGVTGVCVACFAAHVDLQNPFRTFPFSHTDGGHVDGWPQVLLTLLQKTVASTGFLLSARTKVSPKHDKKSNYWSRRYVCRIDDTVQGCMRSDGALVTRANKPTSTLLTTDALHCLNSRLAYNETATFNVYMRNPVVFGYSNSSFPNLSQTECMQRRLFLVRYIVAQN